MYTRAMAAGFLVIGISAALAAGKPATDLDHFQGPWKVVKLTFNGRSAPAEVVEKGKYVFKKNKLTIRESETSRQECEFTLNPDQDPKTIDIVGSDGPAKGKKMLGIYRIKGDTLTLCLGEERPKEFSDADKAGLLELERQKEEKKDKTK